MINLNDKLRVRMKKNPFGYNSINYKMLKLIEKYNVRHITAADVIEEPIET